eukprot:TRINITY_DN48211_c0_g2_i1.p1 TRINITY_DN48211_c0_g2~~TRINITY_DN48211_c0_g2_i1.p1  ORF type:complete len:152 (-),score=25.99 TRINITY_DN48211_c0_g2_i1:159-578(-)
MTKVETVIISDSSSSSSDEQLSNEKETTTIQAVPTPTVRHHHFLRQRKHSTTSSGSQCLNLNWLEDAKQQDDAYTWLKESTAQHIARNMEDAWAEKEYLAGLYEKLLTKSNQYSRTTTDKYISWTRWWSKVPPGEHQGR